MWGSSDTELKSIHLDKKIRSEESELAWLCARLTAQSLHLFTGCPTLYDSSEDLVYNNRSCIMAHFFPNVFKLWHFFFFYISLSTLRLKFVFWIKDVQVELSKTAVMTCPTFDSTETAESFRPLSTHLGNMPLVQRCHGNCSWERDHFNLLK